MAWSPPSLTQLQVKLQRDLRDTDGKVFTPDMLTDYANEGLVELSRVKPIEMAGDISTLPATLDPRPFDIWSLALVDIASLDVEYLPPLDENVATEGWLYFNGGLILGPRLAVRVVDLVAPDPDTGRLPSAFLRWFGYGTREVFDGDLNAIADFIDAEDEICVRRYVRWAGLRALDSDRSLYQQWQTQANNSDVSPTQLTQMTSLAESDWDSLRKKVVIFRHSPLGTR